MDKKVVLIQDEEEILEIMDHILTDEGYDVIPSLTTEPIEDIDQYDADIVIVDEHIKGNKRGPKIIEELKAAPETEELPAILTSTSNDLAQKATQCKADDYIEKPFDIDVMIDVVNRNV